MNTSHPPFREIWLTHLLPVLAWMSLIFFLSHQDRDQSVQTASWVVQILSLIPVDPAIWQEPAVRIFIRKSAHFTEYLILALLTFRFVRLYQPIPSAFWVSLLICACYAATDEFHQSFVPGRGPSVRDVMIDTAGAALGLLLTWAYLRRTAPTVSHK